jgi:hypothetical protein
VTLRGQWARSWLNQRTICAVPATFETGSLDILINNAGIMLPDPPGDDLAALERHLAVHLFGTQAVTQAFLPALIRSRGAVINILSVMALAPLPPFPSYGIAPCPQTGNPSVAGQPPRATSGGLAHRTPLRSCERGSCRVSG